MLWTPQQHCTGYHEIPPPTVAILGKVQSPRQAFWTLICCNGILCCNGYGVCSRPCQAVRHVREALETMLSDDGVVMGESR